MNRSLRLLLAAAALTGGVALTSNPAVAGLREGACSGHASMIVEAPAPPDDPFADGADAPGDIYFRPSMVQELTTGVQAYGQLRINTDDDTGTGSCSRITYTVRAARVSPAGQLVGAWEDQSIVGNGQHILEFGDASLPDDDDLFLERALGWDPQVDTTGGVAYCVAFQAQSVNTRTGVVLDSVPDDANAYLQLCDGDGHGGAGFR